MHDAHAIAWRRKDVPGIEYAKLVTVDSEWYLTGTVVTVEDEVPCELRYRVVIDENWRTISADIRGSLGLTPVSIQIANDAALGWVMNGGLCAGLDGCVDIDLSFTPATNTLPIRRLGLEIGGSGAVSAAWLRFPEMSLERVDQTYTRTGESTYRYQSNGGAFMRELSVNEAALVVDYPGLWQSIAQRTD
jgi:uncharacterized protein